MADMFKKRPGFANCCVRTMFTSLVLISAEYYVGEHLFMPLGDQRCHIGISRHARNFQRDHRRSSRSKIYIAKLRNTHYVCPHTHIHKYEQHNYQLSLPRKSPPRIESGDRGAPSLDKIHRFLSRKETKRYTPGFLEPSTFLRTVNARRAIEPCRGTKGERNGMRKSIAGGTARWEAAYNYT